MGAGWVAGSLRGRLLARHRLGAAGARSLASGDVAAHQHEVWASCLWNLRVLAGWLPADGVEAMRVFAAFFEIRNIEGRLLEPGDMEPAFELGTLATSWPHLRAASSAADIRAVLARSQWSDPGSEEPATLLWNLRLEWARRLAELNEAWGAGAAALMFARLFARGDAPIGADVTRRAPELGRRIVGVSSLPDLQAALPDTARWVFEENERHDTLWRAEARWWLRLERDGLDALHRARPGKRLVVSAAAVLMAHAWRTCAAIEVASRHGRGEEVLDAAR